MLDRFERDIKYLRVSVTDRCNLSCDYCTAGDPPKGYAKKRDILSFEEIVRVVRAGAYLGISKVRLTGGEPLLRKDVCSLVSMIAEVNGITDLSLTTNGVLLERFALRLKRAGLVRVNVSLDTLDPERYARITGRNVLERALHGVDAAVKYGLVPVKLNCVVDSSPDEPDARSVSEYAESRGLEVRYIKRMNLAKGTFGVVHGGSGGNCPSCDRLRLTCDGRIVPCLFSDLSFSVRGLGIEEALRQAIRTKPEKGNRSTSNNFLSIGG